VLELLKQGKSQSYVMKRLKISQQTLKRDIQTLREGTKKLHAEILSKRIPNWSRKRTEKAIEFIKFAEKAMRGETAANSAKKPSQRLPKKTHRAILRMLAAKPTATDKAIARATGTSSTSVKRRRMYLEQQGQIPIVSAGERKKAATRSRVKETGILKKKRRQKIIAEKAKDIKRVAAYVYRTNRKAFDFVSMNPEIIGDELAERLELRLRTYRPDKIPGPEKTKLDRHIRFHLNKIMIDLKRYAWRKYRAQQSLDQAGAGEKPLKTRIEARPEARELTAEKVNEICSLLGLNLIERAVVFGRVIGYPDKKIGEEIGYSESNVNIIRRRIAKSIERARLY